MKLEIITSKQNAALVHARKLLRSRAYRQQCQEYIAEGTKLLEEALKWKGRREDDSSQRIPGLSRRTG